MTNQEYRDFLLSRIPNAKSVSGGSEVNCRCFYCSDSSDPTHGHFYLNIPKDSNSPFMYHCFKCHTSGIVTHQRLLEWNIYDANVAIGVSERIGKARISSEVLADYVYNIHNGFISATDLSEIKRKYINDRLGINLSYQELLDNKIVLNLGDLLSENYIYKYTRSDLILNQLDQNFLGFLSYDNAFINMRNLGLMEVYESISKRYVNYSIFDKKDNSRKFYISPTNIDVANPNPITVRVAEGPFDALSIKYNLEYGNWDQTIFAAATGSGFIGFLRFLIGSLKLLNLEIHIYKDSDMGWNDINDIHQFLSFYKYPLYIHSNIYPGEKDMGVPKSRINEVVQRLYY